MNWLEVPALGLLASLAVLAWLVFMQRGARRVRVGTLFIWRRVAVRPGAKKRRAQLEPVLWLAAGALVVAALASARPALAQAGHGPVVAVFIERLAPADAPELEVEDVVARARDAAPAAELKFFATAKTGVAAIDENLVLLARGAIADELAQFRAHSRDADGRVMFLCDSMEADFGLVLPRVAAKRDGFIFGLSTRGNRIFVRSSGFGAPGVRGAALRGARSSNGETTREYEATAPEIEISAPGSPAIRLRRARPTNIHAGGNWKGDAHRALLSALIGNANYVEAPDGDVALDVEAARRIEIMRGERAELAGATVVFDSQHALFSQLPLSAFDWLADQRRLSAESGERVLLSATRDGRVLGALIVVSSDGNVLRFAGDPFARAPVAAAALLLDNALGVITGERPSDNRRLEIVAGADLPSERAAFAAPFEPGGSLDVSTSGAEAFSELTPWLALAATLLSLAAAWLTRGLSPRGL